MISEDEIRRRAFAMPLTSPAFPVGPYRFFNREFLIVTYRTTREALEKVVPAPLQIGDDPIVKYEFIKMPDSTGFGDYTESGQVIPVTYEGVHGGYVHAMYLDDGPPIFGGRELWGFPKKLANPKLRVEKETLVGTLNFGSINIATATMGYKHKALAEADVLPSLQAPNFLLKIIPHVDGTARICELVRYYMTDIKFKEAWSGPAALQFFHHALAPVADLPVVEVLGGTHIIADLTLGLGEVIHDYLA